MDYYKGKMICSSCPKTKKNPTNHKGHGNIIAKETSVKLQNTIQHKHVVLIKVPGGTVQH